MLLVLDRVSGNCVSTTTHALPIARRCAAMAIAAVKFRKGDALHLDETRQGYVVYNGTAVEFHQWEFRTTLRMTTAANELHRTESTMVDCLAVSRQHNQHVALHVG